ncbi:hypothetical protein Tco_0280915 [Tanacetum coccineum]
MSARDKIGLGYGTQLNEMSNNSETNSEISLSVFYVRSSDEESTPANDRNPSSPPLPFGGGGDKLVTFATPRRHRLADDVSLALLHIGIKSKKGQEVKVQVMGLGLRNSFAYDPNPNSFNDSQNLSDYPPQPQYQTYSCGYDCLPQVSIVYNQKPCFNQNFDNNFPQTSSRFPQQYLCCENCGGPHATFQCQPMNQNFNCSNSFGFEQIQPPRQFDNHQPQEIPDVIPFIESKEWIETKNELYKMMEAYTERMNQQREQEALLAAQREQELLAQKQAAQEKQVPSPYSIFHQLIEEMCGTKASAKQKQKLEEMMLELLELCREKELYYVHDSIEDLIGMAMNTMQLSINLKSRRLDKEKQEVKNIVEQATKRRTRIT